MSVDAVPWELAPPQCRFCGAPPPVQVVLTRTPKGWECSDGIACWDRRAAAARDA